MSTINLEETEQYNPPDLPPLPGVRPTVLTRFEDEGFHGNFHIQGWTKLSLALKNAPNLPLSTALDELLRASKDFFQTPDTYKQEWIVKEADTEEGYYKVEGEKEFYTIRHSKCPSEIRESAITAWAEVQKLFEEILTNIEISLRLSDGALKRFAAPAKELDESRRASMLRLFRYDWKESRIVSERRFLLSAVANHIIWVFALN
jgi:hypothetical protein